MEESVARKLFRAPRPMELDLGDGASSLLISF